MKEFSLKDKVAIITGASRGIGESIALAYSALGANCVLASRKEEALKEAATKIEAQTGKKPLIVPTHVANIEQLEYLVNATLENFGQIDILVNNAATNPVFGPALDCDEGAWDKIMSVNLKGPFFLTKLVSEQMKKRSYGKVINLASVAGYRVMPGLGIYSISKAGIIMMTKVLAFELGPFGIRVNAIAPGLVKTRFSQALWSSEEILKEAIKYQPLQRLLEPQDIVGAAVFLALPISDAITGQVITVDGGRNVI